jgi:hypothetical protein
MSVVIFVLLRLAPGNMVDILFATGGYVSEADKAQIMKELGSTGRSGPSTSTGCGSSSPATSASRTATTSRRGRSSGP